jgi:adenine deaminase
MFREHLPIAYDAPADLKKWPSLNNARVTSKTPYLVHTGTLADCIRELLAKPLKQISLYDVVTDPQEAFRSGVLSPGDAAEIAMRQDFPKG